MRLKFQSAGIGATFAFLAVGFGAFGAHALRERISPEMMAIFQTGVQYQAMHSLALLALGLTERKEFKVPSVLFAIGIVIFSGSLYALALTGIRGFGAVTPLGGVCFLSGWASLAFSLLREKSEAK